MKIYIITCLILLSSLQFGFAATTAPKKTTPAPQKATTASQKPDRNVETKITSDSLTYLADKHQIIFAKQVHVNRPDFELWTDKLTVYLKPAPSTPAKDNTSTLPAGMAAGDVDKLVATGRVRFKRDDKSGTCDKATYTIDTGVMLMEGNPRLMDKENTITGETIRYFTEENKSEVLGSSKKRVEAVFSSPKGNK